MAQVGRAIVSRLFQTSPAGASAKAGSGGIVSPILTRPVREQLEHDRVIRQLQARYKRKTDVIINPGNEQNQSVTVGELVVYPDLLVFAEGARRLLVTVEVETGESVNAIEARAEWGVYSKLRVPLHLYVPPNCVDAARRICDEYQILVAELWTYSMTFDKFFFTLAYKSPDAPVVKIPAKAEKPAPAKIAKTVARPKPAAKAKPVVKAKPAAAAKAKPKAGKPAAKKAAGPDRGRAAKSKPKPAAKTKKRR
jgi:hypothetical protein